MKLAAWAAAAASAVMWVVTVTLIVLRPSETYLGSAVADACFSASFLAFALLGALIAARLPRQRIGWMLCAVGAFMVTDLLLMRYLLYLRAEGGELPAIVLWTYNWLWAPPSVALLTFLPLLFPDGRLLDPRWKPVAVASWVSVAAMTINFMLGPRVTEPFADLRNPFELATLAVVWTVVDVASPLVWGGATLASVAALVVRFRRSRGVERQQLKWFGFALTLVAALITLYSALTLAFGERAAVLVLGAVMPVTVALVPIAAAVAIFRYRLYDIDLVINRALVYGVTTATIAAAFFAGIVILQTLLRAFMGGSELAIAGSTLASFALFQPVRARIQRGVDHRFYRSRYDAARTLDLFSVRLRDEVDLEAVRADLLGVVQETVRPAHGSVWLREKRR